jgi:hypothetical protein
VYQCCLWNIERISTGSGIFNLNTPDRGKSYGKNFQCICLPILVQASFYTNLNKNYLKNKLRMESAMHKQVVYSLQYSSALHAKKKNTILFPLRSTNLSSLSSYFHRFSAFHLKRVCKHKFASHPYKENESMSIHLLYQ